MTIVCFTFIAYLTIGLPLAVLPGYVHHDLGMGSVLAGLVISVQYVATLASRPFAGRLADSMGAKRGVLIGLALCVVSGAFYLLAALIDAHEPLAAFVTLMVGRLFIGCAESLVGTGAIQWAVGAVGLHRTGKVISWNGRRDVRRPRRGAPIGVMLVKLVGFEALGLTVMALGLIGLLLAWRQAGVAAVHGERMGIRHVLRHVANYGLALGLGSMGFGSIATFITLYYASHDWSGRGIRADVFGLCFCGARLLFVDTIARSAATASHWSRSWSRRSGSRCSASRQAVRLRCSARDSQAGASRWCSRPSRWPPSRQFRSRAAARRSASIRRFWISRSVQPADRGRRRAPFRFFGGLHRHRIRRARGRGDRARPLVEVAARTGDEHARRLAAPGWNGRAAAAP